MNWKTVLRTVKDNPIPPRRVEKTNEEWKQILTAEQYKVTRHHGTERPFSGEYCESYSPGVYTCVCCETALFDSSGKFDSRTGWPSFTEPVRDNVVKYISDDSFGMQRVEVLCNVCDAHLGHVFPDGPGPTGLRFCINSVSLKKVDANSAASAADTKAFDTATLGGGCFWCTEAVLKELEGVEEIQSGYAGGTTDNPTYRQVTNGNTGHAEVVQVKFDPSRISYADLLRVFFATHNPTSLNRQGADTGTQYRSIILHHSQRQEEIAKKIMAEMQPLFSKSIVTELVPYSQFFKAEQSHQDFYRNNPENAYCQVVINPKLQKMRVEFSTLLKKKTVTAAS